MNKLILKVSITPSPQTLCAKLISDSEVIVSPKSRNKFNSKFFFSIFNYFF